MDEHDVTAQQGGDDLGILDDLLDDVREEATRERDAESVSVEDVKGDGTDELSPDDMLRQLDAVTLTAGEGDEEADDFDPMADFEDAREDLHHNPATDAEIGVPREATTLALGDCEDAFDLADELRDTGAEEHETSSLQKTGDVKKSAEEPSNTSELLADFSSAGGANGDESLHSTDPSTTVTAFSADSVPASALPASSVMKEKLEAAEIDDFVQAPLSDEQEADPVCLKQTDEVEMLTPVTTDPSVNIDALTAAESFLDDSTENADVESAEAGLGASEEATDVTVAAIERVDPELAESQDVFLDAASPSISPVEQLTKAHQQQEDADKSVVVLNPERQALVEQLERKSKSEGGVTDSALVGSMNPTSTEDDEDSDSQDEDDEESLPPPPLNLDSLNGDDDDELEIDSTVASTIEVERQLGKVDEISVETAGASGKGSGLLAVLLGIEPTASIDEIDFSFADEIRAANVVVPATDFNVAAKHSTQQEKHEDLTKGAFGIGYTSLKKREIAAGPVEDDGYSIPTVPAFPDEREFENELELSSDLVFSVKSMKDDKDQAEENDDDEFGHVAAPSADDFFIDILEAKRASLQGQKVLEEEAIINELKKTTIEEKSINETAAIGPDGAVLTSSSVVTTAEPESALSLKELHGIYKRGLGDQGVVLLDDSDENEEKSTTVAVQSGANPPLSVMGRILSKSSMLAEAITEEGEDEEEETSPAQVTRAYQETFTGHAVEYEDGDSSEAVDEWKEIQLTTHSSSKKGGRVASDFSSKDQQTHVSGDSKPAANFKISYNEAFQYCLQADEFLLQLDKIVAEDFGEGGRSCFSCFSPRPKLVFSGALDERDRVFCIAATSYNPLDDIFTRALQTLYIKLTRTQRQIPLSGSHWEDIGFQGNDPSTDLRGCGVLSLLQMLYLVDNHTELALRFHSLSQHPTRHFPLACALINVTQQCVMALRSGALYKECNKQGSVFKAINSFYVALASDLMEEIRTSSDEIPIIIKDVLEEGRNNPDRVIEEFSKGDARGAGVAAASPPRKQVASAESSTHIEFTEIALQSAASDED